MASPQKQQASDSVVPSTGNVDKEAAEAPSTEPVEDLDALHTEQVCNAAEHEFCVIASRGIKNEC